MERELRDALQRRRHRLHDLALAQPRDARRPPGGEPRRDLGRGAAARRRDGRAERRHLRARGRRRRPRAGDPGLREYHARLRDLAVETGRPITFGVFSRRGAPDAWRQVPGAARRDGRARAGACSPRCTAASLSALLSFKTQMPFDRLPVWKELRALPLDEQQRSCAIPSCGRSWSRPRASATDRRAVGTEARPPTTTGSSSSTPSTARTARSPRSRGSAASTRSSR